MSKKILFICGFLLFSCSENIEKDEVEESRTQMQTFQREGASYSSISTLENKKLDDYEDISMEDMKEYILKTEKLPNYIGIGNSYSKKEILELLTIFAEASKKQELESFELLISRSYISDDFWLLISKIQAKKELTINIYSDNSKNRESTTDIKYSIIQRLLQNKVEEIRIEPMNITSSDDSDKCRLFNKDGAVVDYFGKIDCGGGFLLGG